MKGARSTKARLQLWRPAVRVSTHIIFLAAVAAYALVASGQVFRAWVYSGKDTYLSGSWLLALIMFGPPLACVAVLWVTQRWSVTRINRKLLIVCLLVLGTLTAIFLVMLATSIAKIDR